MENVVKEGGGGGGGEAKCNNENPNPPLTTTAATESDLPVPQPPPPPPSQQSASRTPFTNLSQVDADLALARTLQEQERAYMMLRMNGEGSSDFGSSGEDFDDSEDHHDDEDNDDDQDDQDAFDVHENLQLEYNNDFDPSLYTSDEALARALQDGEDRELADRMMALTGGGNAWDAEDTEDNDSQDTWEEVDPDELSYEELIALGEVVGTESRGLSADTIASLPSVNYKAQSNQDGNTEQCVICRLEYEDEETLTMLSCKHIYHSECINNWLQINKVCPVCNTEVSTSENR